MAAIAYLDATNTPYEGFAPALLAIMEVPAIVVAFALARRGGAIGRAANSTPTKAVRLALPQANPGYYLTASLAITFPFNLTLGLPFYNALARWLAGGP